MNSRNIKKKEYPKISDTKCITVDFNELNKILMERKTKLHDRYDKYHGLIRKLHKYELLDECFVARIHELLGPNGVMLMYKHRLDDIRKVNRLRMEYKHDRLNILHGILLLKKNIQHDESLVRDLHNIIHQICNKYDSNQCNTYRYKLRLTYYDNHRARYDAVVCKPIQLVTIPTQPKEQTL